MDKAMASFFIGTLAFCIARASGVPVWNDGWGIAVVGDAADIGLSSTLAAYFYFRAQRQQQGGE